MPSRAEHRPTSRLAPAARLAAAAGLLALALAAHAAPGRAATAAAGASGSPVRGAVVDDWPRALAQARARGVPIVVDLWAPW